ncbi:MAG TPA: hypothetical protein VHV76_00770 [Mycobacteriales bacterium]|nr:hypothetical protein [Mycobacteriales bacterium]
MVFYQSTQGTPAFRRVSSLDDAVTFAEHLRNVEGVTEFSLFEMSPVTLSLRAYYHVEVSGDAARPAAVEPQAAERPEPSAVSPDDKPASSAGAAESDFVAGTPFSAAPLVPSMPNAQDMARGDAPHDGEPLPPATPEAPAATTVIDPSVVDPTVEEVVPSGRRSMGFFARS